MKESRREESGFSLVFVAITLLVLFGFAAFAVDIAAAYQERRELQRGADATVLAIAEDCAYGLAIGPPPACDEASAKATADQYADANATRDGVSAIDDEQFLLDLVESSVTVVTMTEETDGSNLFPFVFAPVIGINDAVIKARAKAIWGYPLSLATIPIIISECEWDDPDRKGPYPQPIPPEPADDPTLFLFHDGNTTEDCNAEAGQDADEDGKLPGGFGWLDTSQGCESQVEVGNWIAGDPGSSPSTGCSPEVLDDIMYTTVLIPYFDDILHCDGSKPLCDELGLANGKKWYHVKAFGALYVTGYNFGGQYKQPSASEAPCKGDERCIAGYMTTSSSSTGTIGGEFRGVVIVKLTE